jgi:hypothetical protein
LVFKKKIRRKLVEIADIFHRFLSIFGGKNDKFSYDNVLHKLAAFRVQNANFFTKFLGENIFKIKASVPVAAAQILEPSFLVLPPSAIASLRAHLKH